MVLNISKTTIVKIGAFVVTVIVWQMLWNFGIISQTILSPPSKALPALYVLIMNGTMLPALLNTLSMYAVALIISIVLGISIGLVLGLSDILSDVLSPYLKIMNTLPKVALLPVILLFFGYTTLRSEYIFGVLLAVFPIIILVSAAAKNVNKSLITMAQIMGATRAQIFRHVLFTATARNAISASRIALVLAMTGILIKELYVQIPARPNIGLLITTYSNNFNVASLYATIFLIAMLTILFNEVGFYIEQRAKRNFGLT